MLNDGFCDYVCDIPGCGFDMGDCKGECMKGCPLSYIGDNDCDPDCLSEECEWDGEDCGS